jgi:hypothetical protein
MSRPRGRSRLALAGFVAGAVLAGVTLTVHVLLAGSVMVAGAAADWQGAVLGAMEAGLVPGLLGAAAGWWLGSRPCPFHHGAGVR